MTGNNWFSLDGLSSENFGIIVTEPPPEIIPERDVEPVSVLGRSGDLMLDNGRYKNFVLPYKCAILPQHDQNMRDAVQGATALLRPTAGYCRMTDSYRPDLFRYARVSKQISVESIVEQAGEFTLKFDCKPQRFLKSGEEAIPFAEAGTLYNHTLFEAQPIITVYGSGAGTVSISGCTVEIKAMEDQITLDCELMDAYRKVGDGASENKNGSIYAPEFPVLKPGDNTISWTGGVTAVDIIPRWWTL